MFKWKVNNPLGGGGKKNRAKQKLNNQQLDNSLDELDQEEPGVKNINNNLDGLSENPTSPDVKKRFNIFNNQLSEPSSQTEPGERSAAEGRSVSKENLLSSVDNSASAAVTANSNQQQQALANGGSMTAGMKQQLFSNGLGRSHDTEYEEQEALPSDSLYGTRNPRMGTTAGPRPFPIGGGGGGGQTADGNNLAHWSSHGYLAKDARDEGPIMTNNNFPIDQGANGGNFQTGNGLNQDSGGYVVLRRRGDQVMMQQTGSHGQPLGATGWSDNLPKVSDEKEYFSVKGLKHFAQQMQQQHMAGMDGHAANSNFSHQQQNGQPSQAQQLAEKYFSVDSSFLNPDLRNKLRESLVPGSNLSPPSASHAVPPPNMASKMAYNGNYNQTRVGESGQAAVNFARPHPPPRPHPNNNALSSGSAAGLPALPPYQRPPPPPVLQRNNSKSQNSSVDSSRQEPDLSTGRLDRKDGGPDNPPGTSASWHEWTQQLQAYVAWVNSQLRKRQGLTHVKDLRTDLQSGEVLAQLIEIISGEELIGIQYQPESIQGMRENLDRILQFMAAKRIRMHNITTKELLEGNLKSVMRLILALAAHYKPQSVKHHTNSSSGINSSQTDSSAHDSSADSLATAKPTEGQRYDIPPKPVLTGKKSAPSLNSRTSDDPSAMDNQRQRDSGKKTGYDDCEDPSDSYYVVQRSRCEENEELSAHNQRVSVETQTMYTRSPGKGRLAGSGGQAGQRGLVGEKLSRNGSGRKLPQIPAEKMRHNAHMSAGKEEKSRQQYREEDDEEKPEDSNTEQQRQSRERLSRSTSRSGDEVTSNWRTEPRSTSVVGNRSKPKAMEFWESMENLERTDFRYNTIHRMSVGRRILPKPPGDKMGGDEDDEEGTSRVGGSAEGGSGSLNSSFSGPTSLPPSLAAHDDDLVMYHRDGTIKQKLPPDGASLQSSQSCSSGNSSDGGEESGSMGRREVEGASDKSSPPGSVLQGRRTNSSTSKVADTPNGDKDLEWDHGSFDSIGKDIIGGLGNGSGGRKRWDGITSSSYYEDQNEDRRIPYHILVQELSIAKQQLQQLYNMNIGNFDGNKDDKSSKDDILQQLRSQLSAESQARRQLEDELKRHKSAESARDRNSTDATSDVQAEEVEVAREAIASLHMLFNSPDDPGHHILDTLEQCISVILERSSARRNVDGSNPNNGNRSANNSLLQEVTATAANKAAQNESRLKDDLNGQDEMSSSTKIIYFMPRSATPFMTSVGLAIGEVRLADFKMAFDRPGFYRYYTKNTDTEYGMVKEEVTDDEKILPGNAGKIVIWVEEE